MPISPRPDFARMSWPFLFRYSFVQIGALPTRHYRRSISMVDMKQMVGTFFQQTAKRQLNDEFLRHLNKRRHNGTHLPLPDKRVVIPLSAYVCADTAVSISKIATVPACVDIREGSHIEPRIAVLVLHKGGQTEVWRKAIGQYAMNTILRRDA